MQNLKCINGGEATSVCTMKGCFQNPFVCRTCFGQTCFEVHGHGRQHLLSLQQFRQSTACLRREKIHCAQIYQQIDKMFKKARDLIEEQYYQYQDMKKRVYDTPPQIQQTKIRLFNGQQTLLKSNDICQLLSHCQRVKKLPDLRISDYVELTSKNQNLYELFMKLSAGLKSLYDFPGTQRKLKVTWQRPFSPLWKIQQNQIQNTVEQSLYARSQQLIKGGQFQVNFQALINNQAYFGITKKDSEISRGIVKNIQDPVQTDNCYSYHMDVSGRIYEGTKIIAGHLKGRKIKNEITKIKIRLNPTEGWIQWYQDQNLQFELKQIQISQGVYIIVSIDKKGLIRTL